MPETKEETKYDVKDLMTAYRKQMSIIQEGAQKGFQLEGDKVKMSPDTKATIQAAMVEANEIKGLVNAINMAADGEKWFSAPVEPSVAQQNAAINRGPEVKTIGELFAESAELKSYIQRGKSGNSDPMDIKAFDLASLGLGGLQQKDVWTAMSPGTITRTFGRIQFDPTVPRGQRTPRVRDLFPAAATNANLIDFFQVLGFAENSGDGGARSVRERAASDGTSAPAGSSTDTFGLKPKSNLQFRSNQAPVRTIAHWEAAHRNVLDDEPQLQATINNELLYGLGLEEDRQILFGSGANEELLGVMNTPQIQIYNQAVISTGPTVYEKKADTLRRAATLAILANYPATGYVLHPNDWEDIELDKDTQGRYILVTNVAVGAEARVWRQPVVETAAMVEGFALTGAFGTGAQLYDRQQGNIRVAEQHADFFVRNAIAVLAEERLALAVKRPESFIKINFLN